MIHASEHEIVCNQAGISVPGCLMCSPYLEYFHNCRALKLVLNHSTAYKKGTVILIEASVIKSAFQTELSCLCFCCY